MEFHVSVGEALAVFAGELFSFLWYAGLLPKVKGSYNEGDRHLAVALLCGIPLALMLQLIIKYVKDTEMNSVLLGK